ncbi:MAG TPA: prepilin peptidase [Bacilli bacterium]|nr:prepilin peptidase [Bacilli bacterium]
MQDIYYIILFFVFGLVFGSFFNVVSYRIPKGESLIKPSSHCPKCNHKLSFIDLIPVFSYIFQLGKCRYCHKKIPIFYPIVELCTGLLFVLSFLMFGLSFQTITVLVFVSTIEIIILSDILYMIVPDSILLFSGLTLLLLNIISKGINYIPTLLLDMIIPFLFMYLLKFVGDKMFKRESLGGGDIKLMVLIGMVLGWELSITTIVMAAFLALPISLISLIKNKNHELPFVPYIGVSAFILLFLKVDINSILNLLIY